MAQGSLTASTGVVPPFRGRLGHLALGLPLLVVCWALLWSRQSVWNPLLFTGMWSGAVLVMYAGSWLGYPGIRRHAVLMALSAPIWWWFEVVNLRVGNWEYIGKVTYDWPVYLALSTVAFSIVLPALDAAWSLFIRQEVSSVGRAGSKGWHLGEVALGVGLQALVFALPGLFFFAVWVAPFLVLDGLVGRQGGRSIVWDMKRGRWRLAAAVAAGGLLCGLLWEFWNYGATPKWVYHIPWANFAHLFEMPILGYGGYIPFAWSVYQLLHLTQVQRLFTLARK
ncbi:MAG: hypothetical protein EXR55_04570 [Dehalococcoidia bacterium]|nr:hypothetical protein [Dehalococcoidia bacterium]